MKLDMTSNKFKVLSQTQQGYYHQLKDIPCQDYILSVIDKDSICVCLCDGAGSVSDSQIVSQFCCESIIDDFKTHKQEWFSNCNENLAKRIVDLTENKISIEYSQSKHADCTLVLFAQYDNHSLLIHVGDGTALGVSDKETVCLSYPDNNKESVNETRFLSDSNLKNHIHIIRDIADSYDTIIMSSDGASHQLYDFAKDTPVQASEIIREWILADNAQGIDYLDNAIKNIFSQISNDDISIAIIKR